MRNAIETLETRRLMATFFVSNTNDSGAGSLRAAITSANATTAADLIHFNISTASKVISPTSALPTITNPVTVDATTQPGYAGKPLVTLNGSNAPTAGAGFTITGSDVLIRGMAIGNFLANNGAGVIAGIGALRATVRDCYLGVAADGTTAMPNYDGFRSFGAASQVLYSNSSGNQRFGVWLSESGNKVLNSTVGLAPANSAAMGNGSIGVYINGGDFCTVQDSVVAGNVGDGITVDLQTTNAIIDGNIIGMTPNRTALRTNGTAGIRFQVDSTGSITDNRIATSNLYGVFIHNCDNISIERNNIGFGANTSNDFGGTAGVLLSASNYCTVRMNQIGHFQTGIDVYGSHRNTIAANSVGTLLDNSVAMSNGVGIDLEYSEENLIGTDVVNGSDANVISYNTAQGIHVISGNRNSILGNRFRNNGGLDIDLGNVGVTNNDAGDVDTGANTLLNTITPYFGAYNPTNTNTTLVSYRAAHEFTTPGSYRVDFYASNESKLPAGTGEGNRHLGFRTISFSGQGEVTFSAELPREVDGTFISATVTRLVNGAPTDTSEFSSAMRVEGNPQILSSSFEYETGHAVNFRFSRSVMNSITTDDVTIRNLATNQVYSAISRGPGSVANSYNWYFASTLPDGNYRATLNRATVGASVQLGPVSVSLPAEGPNTIDFHILRGDANRDKVVNFDDLLTLSQNYGQSSKTFSQGDFNYDSKVDFLDLLTLAQRFGTSLFSAEPIGGASARKDSASREILA